MIFKNEEALVTVTVEELRADAEKKTAVLREMAAAFEPESDKGPLTVSEIRLAAGTPILYVEKGAMIADAAPGLSGAPENAAVIMRAGIEAELAYGKVLAQCEALARQIRMAMLRTKLRAVHMARTVLVVADAYAKTDDGDILKLHVEQMKQSRRRPRRKTGPATSTTLTTTTK
ncbi:MAG TPA: hypothetical protein VGF28_00130 [Thermoanaerobaculia bacterium]|jgi:hypothetical protein